MSRAGGHDGHRGRTAAAQAADAGISRRSFFNHFKSKDDILISLQAGLGDALARALHQADPALRPLEAVAAALQSIAAHYPAERMVIIDRLMRSNAAVQATNQASCAQHEQKLFAALCALWPDPVRETALRLVAIVSIGALRLSLDTWARENGRRPMADLLAEAFAALKTEVWPENRCALPENRQGAGVGLGSRVASSVRSGG